MLGNLHLSQTVSGIRLNRGKDINPIPYYYYYYYDKSVMELGHLLTRSGLMCPEVSSKICHDSFCQCFITLGNVSRGILFPCCIQFLLS
jgi:hypothetical protein